MVEAQRDSHTITNVGSSHDKFATSLSLNCWNGWSRKVLKSGQRVTNRVTQAWSQADSVTCHCAMLNIPKQNISLNMKKKTSTTCPEKTVLVLDQLSAPNYYEFRAPNYYEFKRLQDLQ
ncbi:unnamed protein product [Lactuca virosa]|uniref:Uncharacterized protein n=1 Tax=Lactuca virosa TaxID=75947 RepID=A0AAU9NGG5_9ASTR|nr:unnamed protein product [Lactuca virosa]